MSDIKWSWLASEDITQDIGDITISFRNHKLCFAMESFSKASELIRIIERLCAHSREKCIDQIELAMFDGIDKLRSPE